MLVNEASGKLMHRCIVCLSVSRPPSLFHPVTQLWINSHLVVMVIVREKCIMLDPAA